MELLARPVVLFVRLVLIQLQTVKLVKLVLL